MEGKGRFCTETINVFKFFWLEVKNQEKSIFVTLASLI